MSEYRLLSGQQLRPTPLTVAATATTYRLFISNRRVPTVTGIGTATGGTTTTLIDAELGATDFWTGRKVRFLSGPNKGLTARIVSYNTGTFTATFYETLPSAVANGHTFEMVPDYAEDGSGKVVFLGVTSVSGSSAGVEAQVDIAIQRFDAVTAAYRDEIRSTRRTNGNVPVEWWPWPSQIFGTGKNGDREIAVLIERQGNWALSNNRFWLNFTAF